MPFEANVISVILGFLLLHSTGKSLDIYMNTSCGTRNSGHENTVIQLTTSQRMNLFPFIHPVDVVLLPQYFLI